MVGVQVDFIAAGGQQGPGQSAVLGTLRLLPQPLAKARVGQWNLSRLSLQPAGELAGAFFYEL